MIVIDGSMGEGGGQVLRTSLALSLVTGRAMRIDNIRAGRDKPGLRRQHLAAVRAAGQVGQAKVTGDRVGSRSVTFEPGAVRPGEYEFDVGTAGSATLVGQTVLPALMQARGPSRLTLIGGTHNPWAPPFDFLARSLLPLLGRMGWAASARLIRPGFFPAGGGVFTVEVQPAPANPQPLELIERGEIVSRRARAIVARLPDHIARRELSVVAERLGWSDSSLIAERADESAGPGNVLVLEVVSRNVTEVFTAFGRLHVAAEDVAAQAVEECRQYLAAGVPVGVHLADQLLLPLALSAAGGAGGCFRTLAPTGHTTTNIEVIRQFLDVPITTVPVGADGATWEIRVGSGV